MEMFGLFQTLHLKVLLNVPVAFMEILIGNLQILKRVIQTMRQYRE